MTTFIAYDIKTDRIFGYTRATSKRAATANFKRFFQGSYLGGDGWSIPRRVYFGGRFGLQTMPLSDWTESEIERASGFAIPRSADVQADINKAFGA